MFISQPDQKRAQRALHDFFVACQRDDKPAATEALRALYAVVDKLEEKVPSTKPKPKTPFHPAHVKASKIQQTRRKAAHEKSDDDA